MENFEEENDTFKYKIDFDKTLKTLENADGFTLGEKLSTLFDRDTILVLLSLIEECYEQCPEIALEHTFTILNKTAIAMEIDRLLNINNVANK